MKTTTRRNNFFWLSLLFIGTVSFLNQVSIAEQKSKAITPSPNLPKTTPWDLKALSSPPSFEWKQQGEISSLEYRGEKYHGKPTRIFAYYATPGSLSQKPELDKNLPAIVLVHGGGGKAFEQWVRIWAKRGYAAIAMDLSGSRPGSGPDQGHQSKFRAIDKPVSEQWSYHAVADVILAHSLIRSFPEVNPEKTAITGISWGGYLTCIVAGLDDRFQAAVPVYGCGFLHEDSSWLGELGRMSSEQKEKWIQLWDPSQYVGATSLPMLFVNGGKDFHYRPGPYAKTFALVKSEKNIRYTPSLAHGHIFDRPQAIEVFIESHLRNGIPLPSVGNPESKKQAVVASVKSKTKLVSVELHFTRDALNHDPKTRRWETKPAQVQGNQIISELPPTDAVVWFLTIRDERGILVSSRLMIPQQ